MSGLKREQVLVIDTETSGLDPTVHSLLSIGLTTLTREESLEIFVVEPDINADPRAMAIHGISLDWLTQNGQSPDQVCLSFERFLEGFNEGPILLAGHNVSFDLSFMRRLYRVARRPWPDKVSHRLIDTHSLLWLLAQGGQIPLEACSSDGAFSYFKCSPPEHLRHSALGDAVATKALLLKILALIDRA